MKDSHDCSVLRNKEARENFLWSVQDATLDFKVELSVEMKMMRIQMTVGF